MTVVIVAVMNVGALIVGLVTPVKIV